MAQEFRYSITSGVRQRVASDNGRFDPVVQVEICERFLIVPDQASRFLSLLEDEIYSYLRDGGKFAGAWGQINLINPRKIVFF